MIITVFGATGLVGKQVVKQALALGRNVRAFGRNVDSLIDSDTTNQKLEAIKGYVFEETDVFDAVKGVDAVISVLGGSFDGLDKARSLGIKNIVAQMEKAHIDRIVALGGLGILDAPDGTLLMDDPNYPEEYLPVGKEHLQAYLYLKQSTLNWTMVGAPDLVDKDVTGNFITAANHPPTPNVGKINAGDLALFMITEAAKNNFVRQKVGISQT